MGKIINWSYERGSWQWDLLCILIMAFIFLTPKAWVDHQKTIATNTTTDDVKVVYLVRDFH